MLILTLAVRNALRNWRRTLLTSGMIVFGTALMVIAMGWIDGIFSSMIKDSTAAIGHVRIADPDYVERETLAPMYENLSDVDALVANVQMVEGVEHAYPVIRTGAAVSVGEELGDNFAMVIGAPAAFFEEQLTLKDKVVEGGFFTGADDEILLGARLARKVEAKVGEDVLLLGATQDGAMSPIKGKLVGVVQGGSALTDQSAFVPLAKAQYMVDIEGGAIEVRAYTADHNDAPALRDAVAALPAVRELSVQSWTDRAPWNSLVGIVGVMQGILGGFVLFITALGIWNTMMMSVLERTGEIGVMRAMGLGRLGTVWLFVLEAMGIGLLGGILGAALGFIPAYYLATVGITLGDEVVQQMGGDFQLRATMYGTINAGILLRGVLLAVITGVVGSIVPAIRAALIQPVTAMRQLR